MDAVPGHRLPPRPPTAAAVPRRPPLASATQPWSMDWTATRRQSLCRACIPVRRRAVRERRNRRYDTAATLVSSVSPDGSSGARLNEREARDMRSVELARDLECNTQPLQSSPSVSLPRHSYYAAAAYVSPFVAMQPMHGLACDGWPCERIRQLSNDKVISNTRSTETTASYSTKDG